MKTNLKKCKEELLQKRTDLLNLWYKSQQYKEMLSILETMYGYFDCKIFDLLIRFSMKIREELRTTPEKIDAMMDSKHVLCAAKLLVTSLKQIMNDDMMQIGALDDIRRTLSTQKNVCQMIPEFDNTLTK